MKYYIRPNNNQSEFFSHITKLLGENTNSNTARKIFNNIILLRSMTDEQNRVQYLKDSPHVLKDEVYMKLEETLDALEHICSKDHNMERWDDGLEIIGNYMYKINYREMDQRTYEELRKTSVNGLLAEILTCKIITDHMPC